MPDLVAGAGELFAGGGDFLSSLLGAGGGAAAADAGAALGPTALGTAGDFLGQGGFDALSGSALAGTGADVLGTAGSFLGAPAASALGSGAAGAAGFGAAADSALSSAANTGAPSGIESLLSPTTGTDAFAAATPTAGFGTTAVGAPSSASLPPSVANANAGASVFDTGTSPVQGVGSTGQPAAGAGASSVSAPSGVTAAPDATSGAAATGQTAGTAAPAAAKTSSIGDLLSKAETGAMNSVTNNPLGIGLGAAGLGYNILQGQKQTANQSALSGAASTAAQTGQQAFNAGLPVAQQNNTTGQGLIQSGEALQTYMSTGQLPPQYTQQIDQAINSAKTAAISNAASQGQPTDPTKNTSLAATLAGIDNQRAAMTTQVAQTLFSAGGADISAGAGLTGTSESALLGAGQSASGLSASLYQSLVANDTAQAANTGKAIATLAAALNGKSNSNIGGTNIQISQAA